MHNIHIEQISTSIVGLRFFSIYVYFVVCIGLLLCMIFVLHRKNKSEFKKNNTKIKH